MDRRHTLRNLLKFTQQKVVTSHDLIVLVLYLSLVSLDVSFVYLLPHVVQLDSFVFVRQRVEALWLLI